MSEVTNETMIAIPASEFDTINPNAGAGRTKVPVGDYKFRVADVILEAKQNSKTPHVMAVMDFEVIEAITDSDECRDAIGGTVRGWYGGSAQSPKFMLQRLRQLADAVGVKAGPKGIPIKDLKGRTFDGSIVWELSQPKQDAETGETKRWANSKLVHERPNGKESKFDPFGPSKRAIAFDRGEPAAEDEVAGASNLPWKEPAEEAIDSSASAGEVDDEAAAISEYRARIAIKDELAGEAKAALEGAGIPIDGPIDANHLSGDLKDRYAVFVASASGTGNGGKKLGLPLVGKKLTRKATQPTV